MKYAFCFHKIFGMNLIFGVFFPGLSRSPTPRQLERALDELNAGRPQCPVGLHTLIVPRKNSQNISPEAQPMVYLKCGHVQVSVFLFGFKREKNLHHTSMKPLEMVVGLSHLWSLTPS